MKYKFTKEELKNIKEFEKNFKGYQAVRSFKSEVSTAPDIAHLNIKI
jgi:hypothetical protein